MTHLLSSILMATNLKEYNKKAFDVAISLAAQYDARLVLLHVLEEIQEPFDDMQIEKRMLWLKGKSEREAKRRTEIETARRSMLGKQIGAPLIQDTLRDYFERNHQKSASSAIPLKEVIVAEGDVVEEILARAKEHDCSMIVMGAHEGLLGKTSVSSILRKVMKRSTVPVLMVPSIFKIE